MSTRADLALVGRTVASAAHSGTKICPVTEADIVCRLLSRNGPSREFFTCEARRLAVLCREMAERFLDGGRLLAFGRGPWATDAQHIAVEFVHPVIVGKRALPALDISSSFEHTLPALVRRRDIVIGFGPPEGDPVVANAIAIARRHRVRMALIERWSAREGHTEKFAEFRAALRAARSRRLER